MRSTVILALIFTCLVAASFGQTVGGTTGTTGTGTTGTNGATVGTEVTFNTNVEGDVPNNNQDAICKALTITKDKTKCTYAIATCVICKTCTKGKAFWMSDLSANLDYAISSVAEKKTWSKYCKDSLVAVVGLALTAMAVVLA